MRYHAPMNLKGKQKRLLKARGQTMDDDLRLGKDGLTERFAAQLRELLGQRGLVKLRFTDLTGGMRNQLANEIAEAVDAQCVSIIGRTMLLYRPGATGADAIDLENISA